MTNAMSGLPWAPERQRSVADNKMALYSERIAVVLCCVSFFAMCSLLFFPAKQMPVAGVQIQMLSLLALCILHAAATKGWQKTLGFSVISFFISWFVEFIGCNYGWWFGDYEYTSVLGYSIGNVPLMVVVSWDVVIYPSLLLVDELMGGEHAQDGGNSVFRIAAASGATALVTTAWDLTTDPVAIEEGFWKWDFGGRYLPEVAGGVPFSNFWGWIGAVFIISFLYRWLFTRGSVPTVTRSPLLFAAAFYTSLIFGGIYSSVYHELYLSGFLSVFVMGPVAAIAWCKYIKQRF